MRAIDIRYLDIPEQDAGYEELAEFANKIAELATDAIEVAPVRHGRWIDGAKMYDPCGDCQEFSCDYCPNKPSKNGW